MGGQPAFSGNTSGRSKGNMYGEAGRGKGQAQRRGGGGGGDWKNQKSRLQMARGGGRAGGHPRVCQLHRGRRAPRVADERVRGASHSPTDPRSLRRDRLRIPRAIATTLARRTPTLGRGARLDRSSSHPSAIALVFEIPRRAPRARARARPYPRSVASERHPRDRTIASPRVSPSSPWSHAPEPLRPTPPRDRPPSKIPRRGKSSAR